MHQFDDPSGVSVRPTVGSPGTPGWATDGNALSGILGSVWTADWFNDLQGNLLALLSGGGITPTKGPSGDSDLLNAIKAVTSQRVPVSSFSSNTTATASDILKIFSFTATATLTLPSAASAANGWSCQVQNISSSSFVTVNASTGSNVCVLAPGESVTLITNGSAWYVRGRSTFYLPETSIPSSTAYADIATPVGVLGVARKIDIVVRDFSLSGTNKAVLQLGYGTGPTYLTSGYGGSAYWTRDNIDTSAQNVITANSTGFIFGISGSNFPNSTIIRLARQNTNIWNFEHVFGGDNESWSGISKGSISLPSQLTGFRFISSGTNNVTGGTISVMAQL